MFFRKPLCLCLMIVSLTAQADSGDWYLGLDLGQSDLEHVARSPGGAIFLDDDGTAWGANVGYHLQPWLAVEVAYYDHGSYSGNGSYCPIGVVCALILTPVRAELESLSLNLVPVWRVNERLSLSAKLGLSRWNLSVNLEPGKFDDTEFLYGGNVLLHLTEQLDLQTGFEIAGDRETFLAGLRWNF